MNSAAATKLTRMRRISSIAGMCGIALIPKQALAQRGVTLPYQPPAMAPSSGISGIFDANVVNRNYFVSDFPTLSVDYGIGRDVTIGTSLVTAFSLAQELSKGGEKPFQFFNGKLRYRLLSHSGWSAAFTGYYAYLHVKGRQSGATTHVPAATLNVVRDLKSGSAGLSLLHAQVRSVTGTESSVSFNRTDKLYRLLTGWWRPTLTTTTDLELLASLCVPTQAVELSNFSRIDISESCFTDKKYSGFLRALLGWRTSQNWLLSMGVIWTPDSTTKLIPVLAAHHVAEFFTRAPVDSIQPTTDAENEE